MPTKSVSPLPLMDWMLFWIWSPMTGNWASAESRIFCCASSFPSRTNPRIVVNTISSGNSEKNP